MVLRNEIAFFLVIILFGLTASIVAFIIDAAKPFNLAVRLFALNGFIALSVASILSAFLKEVTLFFKKPFVRIHHYFAAAGLVLITLHPLVLFFQSLNLAVFLPNFGSLELFLYYAGRPSLIIIYIAFVAVLLRRKIQAYWRFFHALMYVALFFGLVHGNLSGRDFGNIGIAVAFNVLFVVVLAAFVWKRWQLYKTKANSKKRLAESSKQKQPKPAF